MEVTQTELAEIFEVHPRTIRRWQDAGMPSLGTGPQRTYRTRECIQWRYEQKLQQQGSGGEEEGEGVPDKDVSEARRKAAQAELKELKVRERREELIPAARVMDLLEDVLTRVRQRLVNLPGRRLKEIAASTDLAEVRGIRMESVREILEEMQDVGREIMGEAADELGDG